LREGAQRTGPAQDRNSWLLPLLTGALTSSLLADLLRAPVG